jgi:hypothetical protein
VNGELEIGSDALLRLLPPGLVMLDRVDPACAQLRSYTLQLLLNPATSQDQPGAKSLQRALKARQTVVQPPTLCATDLPTTGSVIIQDVNGHDAAGLRSRQKSWLVSYPQVLTKPNDGA